MLFRPPTVRTTQLHQAFECKRGRIKMGAPNLYPSRTGQPASSVSASVLDERAILLSASPLCTGLSHDEVMKIASCARPKSFARDESLFVQGQPASCLVLIRTGAIKITQI